MATTVDLSVVREVICNALRVIDLLDGTVTDHQAPGTRPTHATVNDELLNLSDELMLASALVKAECWTGQGILSHGF